MSSTRIKPLAKDVVNRIAAGEIIIGPSNALKELLENSIDAKATQIDVLTKKGGLKLLQIIDNGTGIHKEDMPILCERFTTSKLTEFEDLKSIATYGFRGEALASISHVARLSVITKTKNEQCASKANYLDGEMVGGDSEGITPVAGKDGTSLIVEDLFYNVPSRLRALKGSSDEYTKVVDVVSKYSIHVNEVGFSCQRQDGRGGKPTVDIMVRKGMSRKDRIRNIYGSSVANSLLDLEIEPVDDIGLFKCHCSITNTNFDNKKSIAPVVFINNRLVVCDPLRRAIGAVYSAYLPKGHKPFIYIALEIVPQNVDVNVHPTKREVRFLNEDEIIEHISFSINNKLASLDTSRSFTTQQVLSHSSQEMKQDEPVPKRQKSLKVNEIPVPKAKSIDQMKKLYEHQMVRTDFNQSTLNSFVKNQNHSVDPNRTSLSNVDDRLFVPEYDEDSQKIPETHEIDVEDSMEGIIAQSTQTVERSAVKLMSIKELRQEVEIRTSKDLTQLFAHHTFVGIADYTRRLCCLQYDVNLYLVDYGAVFAEFFYQVGLSDFANFGRIDIEGGINVNELIENEILANETLMSQVDPDTDVELLVNKHLVDMEDMWLEYFNVTIEKNDSGQVILKSMPLLVSGYTPPWSKMSLFLWKVLTRIEWEDEKKCLAGIIRQLALLHVPASCLKADSSTLNTVENVLFPLVKRRFLATENLARDIIEMASLPGLYKVFERC